MDFILYLFETEQEERVYTQWLHTSMQQSFKDFKKAQGLQKTRKTKADRSVTEKDVEERLQFATQFIKPKIDESGVE